MMNVKKTNRCIVCKTVLVPFILCTEGTVTVCPKCGLGATQGIPDKKTVFRYYEKFYDAKESARFHSFLEFAIAIFRHIRVRIVEAFAPHKGKILDVGFGRPLDLEIFERRGWHAFGTQIVPYTVKVANQHGLKAFLGEFPSARYSKSSFDVVTFWHVLEHLHDPGSYLREANRVMKPNGKLIIEVPNIESPIAHKFGSHWLGLDLPHHLFHFTPKALTMILHQNGFRVVKTKFFSLEQSPFASLQTVLNALTGQRNVVFESMKKQGLQRTRLTKIMHVLLAIALAPFAFGLSLILGLTRQGDIMRFYCVKK